MKKIISIILAAVMLITPMMHIYADNIEEGSCGENAVWNYDDVQTIHISGVGDMENYDFGKAPYIKYSSEARFLSVGSGITSIGDAAFRGLYLVRDVNIGKDVKRIGKYAFSMCHSMTWIKLPDSLEEIDEYAFSHCSKLESVSIPEGVRELKKGTFEHNYALKTVNIPSTMQSIDLSAFDKCDSIEEINVAPNNEVYSSIDGVLYAKDGVTLVYAPKGKTSAAVPEKVTSIPDKAYFNNYSMSKIDVPEGVKSIGKYAFGNCISLKKITLPEGIEEIKENAFIQCERLVRLKLPSTLKTIGEAAFWGCGDLTEIEIPSGVTRLPKNLFTNCVNLEKVVLPDSITHIESDAFFSCKTDIYYKGSEEQWNSLTENVKISDKNLTVHFNYEPTVSAEITEDTIRIILDGEYLETDVNPIIVDDRTLVPMRVIFEAMNMIVKWDGETQTVEVYDSPRSTVPEITMTIGAYEFTASSRTLTLDVPAQIVQDRTMVPLRAVSEALNRSVEWDGDTRTVTIISGTLPEGICGYDARWTIDDDGTLTVSGSGVIYDVDTIGQTTLWADKADKIKKVIIGEGITRIGARAFEECKNLESIEFASTVKEIGHHAFYVCGFEEITIPETVELIGTTAFADCKSLKKAEILGPVTKLDSTFVSCENLEIVKLPDTVEVLGGTFWHCDSLKNVNMPSSLKRIGWVTFCDCTSLESITLPQGLTYIGDNAFSYCDSLSEVILPDGLEEIDKEAFKECPLLEEMFIPKTVINIGTGAFWGCNNINVIYESEQSEDNV